MFCLCSLFYGVLPLFKSLSCFEFIFVYDVRECSNFIDLQWLSSFPSTTCWRDCLFSMVYSWLLCQRLIDCRYVTLFLSSLFCSIDPYVCFLCQHHAVLIIIALLYCVTSKRAMPPALFFFLRTALAILGHLWSFY